MSTLPDDFKALVAEHANGTLEDSQFERLQEILREDPTARTYFREYMNLDAALFDAAAAEDADLNAWTAPAQARRLATRTSPLVWVPAAAAAVMALGLIVFWPSAPDPQSPGTTQAEEARAAGFAILTRLIDAEWEEGSDTFRAGDSLAAGRLRLKSGVAQIEFYSGATVLLEGASDFEIVSAQRAHCHRGRLRAEVPPAARGFTIVTPETEVVDLGTEIGIAVGQDGHSEVHVFDGEVELHDHNGSPAQSLRGGEAVAFGNGPQQAMPANGSAFAKLDKFEPQSEREQRARFERWKAHSLELRKDPRLLVYYPCDHEGDWQRRVLNEAGDPERLGALVGVTRSEGRWPWKGAVEFRRPGDRVRLYLPGEYSSLTLACWVRLDSVDRMWNSLYLTDGYEQGEVHWQITNGKLAYSMKIREEGMPKQHLYLSPSFWTPELSGRWIHLATVYDAQTTEVIHYLNGEELSREPAPENAAVPVTRFGAGEIGNWGLSIYRTDPGFVVRSLNGLMDEFAIFGAALSPDEIAAMAEAGNPGQ